MVKFNSEFYATYKMFAEYLSYSGPVIFNEWDMLDDDKKAAWLYVQYFDEVLLAWMKCNRPYVCEQEAVETLLQYLCKNVKVVHDNPNRFNERYIYRISFNSLYPLCRRKCDIWGFKEIVPLDCAEELMHNKSYEFDYLDYQTKIEFWNLVYSDDEIAKLADNILNHKRGFRGKRKQAVIEKSKNVLSEYVPLFV